MNSLIPPIGTADNLFHDGNPATGELGTIVSAEWLNNIQGAMRGNQSELIALLTAAGIEPNAAKADQVLTALRGLFLGKTAQAADSATLEGHPASYFARAADLAASGSKPGRLVVTFRDTPEPGTLVCNGAAISRTTYARLFAAIGSTYGAGDGSSTFNLPNIPDGHALLAANGSPVGSNTPGDVKSHSHTASGSTGQDGNHQHTQSGTQSSTPGGVGAINTWGGHGGGITNTVNASGLHTHAVNLTVNTTGAANNLAAGMHLLVCISYE